jgi:uncharacterized membrane protein
VIGLGAVYLIAGAVFAAFAILGITAPDRRRRWKNSAFWALLATSFLLGDQLGDFGNGVLVLTLVVLAGFGGLAPASAAETDDEQRKTLSERLGSRLLIPALALPLVTVIGTVLFKQLATAGYAIVDPAQATLVSLTLAAMVAALIGLVLLRQPIAAPLQEGRRLIDSVGWAAILPQMLAALGAVFAAAGVGEVIGAFATQAMPADNRDRKSVV